VRVRPRVKFGDLKYSVHAKRDGKRNPLARPLIFSAGNGESVLKGQSWIASELTTIRSVLWEELAWGFLFALRLVRLAFWLRAGAGEHGNSDSRFALRPAHVA